MNINLIPVNPYYHLIPVFMPYYGPNGISITRSPVEIPFRALLFEGIKYCTLLFCSMTHYDITIGNNVAMDVHCEIIMGHSIVMGTYHDVTMHTNAASDVATTLIYYVLLHPIMIFLFS